VDERAGLSEEELTLLLVEGQLRAILQSDALDFLAWAAGNQA
jgi:hypothetical protein